MSAERDRPVANPSAFERTLADRSQRVRAAPIEELTRLTLTPVESFIVSRIDGSATVSDLLVVSGLPEEQAFPVLLNLLVKGAIVAGAPAGAPANARLPAGSHGAYSDFVFDIRELQEAVDLDFEKKKQLLYLFHHLDRMSHYRLLGVPPIASSEQIHEAFLARSKELHPDAFFRRNLGSFRGRLERIFEGVKAAHDLLTDPERRARYDQEAANFTPQERAGLARKRVEVLEDEKRVRLRRDRILHGRGFARLTKARDRLVAGDAALKGGGVAAAMREYQAALELDPRFEDARARLDEARKVANMQRSDTAVARAEECELAGNPRAAITILKSAVEVEPSNATTRAALAATMLRAGAELASAHQHALRAWDLGMRTPSVRLLAGEILLAMGQKKAAREQFRQALDMGDERAKQWLKRT